VAVAHNDNETMAMAIEEEERDIYI